MINKLLRKWANWYMKCNPVPDFVIGDDYLRRWWVIPRNRVCNIYLHVVMKDDEDRALHDHPWPSFSYIIDGAYYEVFKNYTRILDTGQYAFRKATTAHRLAVMKGPVVTLFITGPKSRSWGFHCPQGWRHWEIFTSGDDSGKNSRGCE